MSSEDRLVMNYMALLRTLPADLKLRLIALLSESIAADYAQKKPKNDWRDLFGSWKDTDDDLAEQVRAARLPNRDIPPFDE